MVLSAAGDVDHEALLKQAESKFSGLSSSSTTARELVAADPAKFTGSEVRMLNPDVDQVHFAVAFKGASWSDPDVIPLMVMQTMLGSWNSRCGVGKDGPSTLSNRVASNGLAESYTAFNTNFHDAGLFGIYATGPKDRSDDLAWAIMQEFPRMCFDVSEAEVARARNALKTMMVFAADGTTGAAEDIGRQLLVHGRRVPKAELMARIDAVDAGVVKQVADRFLYDQDVAIAAAGNTYKLPDYNWFRRRTYLLRY